MNWVTIVIYDAPHGVRHHEIHLGENVYGSGKNYHGNEHGNVGNIHALYYAFPYDGEHDDNNRRHHNNQDTPTVQLYYYTLQFH